eukprot:scaffold222882_cov32-Prasinocladus_malaysianus.AAC.1
MLHHTIYNSRSQKDKTLAITVKQTRGEKSKPGSWLATCDCAFLRTHLKGVDRCETMHFERVRRSKKGQY